MNAEQEILESFLSDAADWGDKFMALAFEMTDSPSPLETVREIFLGVHSLKGGAAFIAQDVPRLRPLTGFCHEFETFLDAMRKGKIEMGEKNRDLAAKALYALHDDIAQLQRGEDLRSHEELLSGIRETLHGAVVVDERGNTIIFRLTKNIQHPKDAEMFHKIVSDRVRTASRDTRVIFDLCGIYRLSSMVVGSIIGTLGSVTNVAIAHPPSFMKLVFRRFRFDEFGIQIMDSAEECRE